MDLSSLDPAKACSNAVEVELTHPATGAPLGIFFSVIGSESPEVEAYRASIVNRMIRRRQEGRGPEIESVEAQRDREVEMMALCTKGWREGDRLEIEVGGKWLPFNHASALKVYSEQAWVRKQIDQAVGDLKRFFSQSQVNG